MSNQEILEKAAQKAIDGGWYPFDHEDYINSPGAVLDWFEADENMGEPENYKMFIFNHDFAKALWGEKSNPASCIDCGLTVENYTYWQYHLQQMVIAEDPIAYLGEHLDD